jgi:uncharacterized protein
MFESLDSFIILIILYPVRTSFIVNQKNAEDLKSKANRVPESASMPVGLLNLHILIPGCTSLKEKRSRLKPLLSRLHKEFNVSVAEMDLQDAWQEAVLVCAWVGNDKAHVQRSLQKISDWIEKFWPDVTLLDDHIEMI